MDLILLAAGLVVGILVGLTGMGGGALMTPTLIIYGIPPVAAVGTDLVYAAITKSAGAVVHQWRRNICWPIVGHLALGSLPASAATLWGLSYLNRLGIDYGSIITFVLGIALVLTALVVLLRPWLMRIEELPAEVNRPWATVAGGALLGVLVSASSVGAGVLGTAVLLILHRHLPISRVIGTDLAHAVLLATLAGFGHWQMGNVDFALLLPLLAGSIPGVYIGARLTGVIPDRVLAPIVALVLLSLGIGLSFGAVV